MLVLTRTILELEPSGDFGMSLFLAGTMLDNLVILDFHFVWHAQYWKQRTHFNMFQVLFQYTMRPRNAKSKHCEWAGCG